MIATYTAPTIDPLTGGIVTTAVETKELSKKDAINKLPATDPKYLSPDRLAATVDAEIIAECLDQVHNSYSWDTELSDPYQCADAKGRITIWADVVRNGVILDRVFLGDKMPGPPLSAFAGDHQIVSTPQFATK